MKYTLTLLCALAAASLHAGPIALSGDVNITSNLATEPGNQTFFNNLLGAGTQVLIRTTPGWGSYATAVEIHYDSVPGVSASQVGAVTAASLVGVNLFVGITSGTAYTAAEVAALTAFSAGGGRILLMGENQAFPTENGVVNALLAALGSSLRIGAVDFDYGFHDAIGAQIVPGALSAGVVSLNYAAPSNVLGGTAVFRSADLAHAFVAHEGFDVPEPASLVLSFAGLLLLVILRRRRYAGP